MAISGRTIRNVLDVGCGAGQEMLPFVRDLQIPAIGVDVAPSAGLVGRELFGVLGLDKRVHFARACAENLPLRDNYFDLVICRVALPYMNNRQALSEMSRVLHPDGVILLQIHHARFYLRKLHNGLISLNIFSFIHSVLALFFGTVYHFTDWQSSYRRFREVYQTELKLRQELARSGLVIKSKFPDSDPATPSYLIEKSEITIK